MGNFITLNGQLFDLSEPIVMAIVNVTPDSFYEKSRKNVDFVVETIKKSVEQGAKIIDIGGCSTRPNAIFASEKEEENRVCRALEKIRDEFPNLPISIDTFREKIAKKVVEEFRVNMINDISGGSEAMFDVVAQLGVPYVLTHSQKIPEKTAATDAIYDYFVEKLHKLRFLGVKDIILDPGFGFEKTVEQNYEVLKKLRTFESLKLPILGGISRKSMIYKMVGTTPELALNGTTVLNTLLLREGAKILRVHDVKEAMEAVVLYNFFRGEKRKFGI